MTSTQTVDGRSARAQRTRDSVVSAVLELAGAGQVRPTAREIAERAGISVRSVYVHFDDLDDLFRAAADRHFEQMRSLLQPVDATLVLDERIRAAVDQRIAIFETFGAIRRAAEQWAPQSAALAEVMRAGRDVSRNDIDRLFGAVFTDDVDHEVALGGVTMVMSADAWDSLRRQGLSVEAAREIVLHTTSRLLDES